MSDERNVLAARVTPAEEAARESRHEVLRELLGAYADDPVATRDEMVDSVAQAEFAIRDRSVATVVGSTIVSTTFTRR